MSSLKELKAQIEKTNALGVSNLREKGVNVSENATTYEIMQGIAEVKNLNGIESLDHTVTFTVDGEAVEIVSVKSGNSVNIPVSIVDAIGVSYEWFFDGRKVSFPYAPTENVTLEGTPCVSLVASDLNHWYKNSVQEKNFQLVNYDANTTENKVTYSGTDGYEYAYYPISLEKGKTYEFSLEYKIENLVYQAYAEPGVPFISFAKEIIITSSQTQWYKALAGAVMNNPAGEDYKKYSVTYQATEDFNGYVVLDTACLRDGVAGTLYIKNIVVRNITV